VCQISEGFSVWALKRKRLETTRHQYIIKTARQAGVDPYLPVIALQSGRRKSKKWPFRDSRRAIFRGAAKITGASESVQEVMREEICLRKPRACLN
jgi:hypothetical protein